MLLLSPTHGLNPTIPVCFLCGQEKNELVLMGRLPQDAEAPRRICVDRNPCDTCAGYMKQGVILISVKDGSEGDQPHRTGNFAVLKDEAITRVVHPPELASSILKVRVAFVPDEAWKKLGLPQS